MPHNGVSLNRALSKLGIMSRTEATRAIEAGRVQVDGRLVTDPARRVSPERSRILLDGTPTARVTWRSIVFHKPRGVVTTRRDPQGRATIYDALGDAARGLIPVGRLDLATSGLLLMTTDTQLANWITDPANAVSRVYVVVVRGRVGEDDVARLTHGIESGRDRLGAHRVTIRKASARESHLIVELLEGKNREVRRLFEAIGHEVTGLKRVRLGGLELGRLASGEWREVSQKEIVKAFRFLHSKDVPQLRTQRTQR
jgi:23S rRNA pseudouridine2605 synthase